MSDKRITANTVDFRDRTAGITLTGQVIIMMNSVTDNIHCAIMNTVAEVHGQSRQQEEQQKVHDQL